MRAADLLAIHLLVLLAKSLKRGGIKSVIAENLLLKQQLIVMGRTRLKAPNSLRVSNTAISFTEEMSMGSLCAKCSTKPSPAPIHPRP